MQRRVREWRDYVRSATRRNAHNGGQGVLISSVDMSPARRSKSSSGPLKGWKAIAEYLGQPIATVQTWAKSGLPVTREGRFMTATPEQLADWLARESGVGGPVHIAVASDQDLTEELRRTIKAQRQQRGPRRSRAA